MLLSAGHAWWLMAACSENADGMRSPFIDPSPEVASPGADEDPDQLGDHHPAGGTVPDHIYPYGTPADEEEPPLDYRGMCATDPLCTDVDTVAPLWTAEEPYDSFGSVTFIGDANGDGLRDMLVETAIEKLNSSVSSIIYAPLVRPLVLPRDADLQINDGVYAFGDYDADGDVDLIAGVQNADPFDWDWYGLVPGPLASVIDTAADATALVPMGSYDESGRRLVDTNHDGLLELATVDPGFIQVWQTDPAGWGAGDPTLTVDFECGEDVYWQEATLSSCDHDPDDDGVYALTAWGGMASEYMPCEVVYLPAGISGVIVPETSALAVDGACATAVGDQDLDGHMDYFENDDGGIPNIVAGPIVFNEGIVAGTVLLYTYDGYGTGAGTLDLDVTGDGIHDFQVVSALGAFDVGAKPVSTLSGGLNGGIETGMATAWYVTDVADVTMATFEDGTGYAIFADTDGVKFVAMK